MAPDFAGKHSGLDRGPLCDAFHGVDARLALASNNFLKKCPHHRHARRPADEYQPVDPAGLDISIVEGLQHRLPAALDDRPDDALKLGARELVLEMKRPGRPGGEERQRDPGRRGGGEFNLGDFAGLP